MSGTHEHELQTLARELLGTDEVILGAGYFGMSNLALASSVGAGAGAVAGSDFGTAATLLSSVIARRVAINAAAAAQGMTVRLLVAMTPTLIHVLNEHTDPKLKPEVATFARDRVNISIRKFGLSRTLTLTDTDTASSIDLHGTVAWISAHAEGDKVVLELLASEAS